MTLDSKPPRYVDAVEDVHERLQEVEIEEVDVRSDEIDLLSINCMLERILDRHERGDA